MDGGSAKQRWSFMVEHMPRVVAMLKEQRAKGQGSHVDACWKAGVVRGEPGQFWASEGQVSVGTPPAGDLVPQQVLALLQAFPGSAVLMLAGQVVGEEHGPQ